MHGSWPRREWAQVMGERHVDEGLVKKNKKREVAEALATRLSLFPATPQGRVPPTPPPSPLLTTRFEPTPNMENVKLVPQPHFTLPYLTPPYLSLPYQAFGLQLASI